MKIEELESIINKINENVSQVIIYMSNGNILEFETKDVKIDDNNVWDNANIQGDTLFIHYTEIKVSDIDVNEIQYCIDINSIDCIKLSILKRE